MGPVMTGRMNANSYSHPPIRATRLAPPPLVRLTLLLILLTAFALRSYTLDSQSFWSDEGISLQRAALPLGEMLAAMPVEHTPGYFVALHIWMALTGDRDFGVRFLSLWPSVLSVALIFRFAADLSTATATRWVVGVIGAGLMATGWFQVWYAQEARMYSWLLAAGLTASWALWRVLYDERRRIIFAGVYALAVAASVYLHFYGFLTPITHSVFMLGWLLVTRRWRIGLYWVGAGVVAFLLFLPWLPRSLGIFGFGGWRESGNPQEIPWRYLTAYTTGAAMPPELNLWLPWLYLALLTLGGVWWLRQRTAAGLFLLVNTVLPLGIVYALAVGNPDFHERYSIVITASLLVLVAGGVAGLDVHRWAAGGSLGQDTGSAQFALPSVVVLILLMGANVAALNRQAVDDSFHKPDFRGAASRIQQMQQPGDVILVDGPNPELVFNHYYTGGLPVHDLRPLADADGDEIDRTLTAATRNARRAWEVLLFHEPASVQVWLATRGYASEPTGHNGIRVTLYGLETPQFVQEQNLRFGSALILTRSEVNKTALTPGDLLQVATEWRVNEPAPEYKFSLRLSDASGAVVQSQDYVPQIWVAPTNVWVTGQQARDQHGLYLRPDLAPGRYRVTLRLYDPATGAAVETEAGQDVPLAEVEVQ